LGEFFGVSPFWFRLAFLIALVPGGVRGFSLYLLFWLIIPSASSQKRHRVSAKMPGVFIYVIISPGIGVFLEGR